MPGETVSGNVNIVTRSAFDYSGLRVAGKAGYGDAELGNGREYEASAGPVGPLSRRRRRNRVLVSGSYYNRRMVTDNFEIDWERVSQDQRPGNETRFWARETENKLYRLTRKNYSASGRIDWEPDSDNRISIRSIYTIFTDDEARQLYL